MQLSCARNLHSLYSAELWPRRLQRAASRRPVPLALHAATRRTRGPRSEGLGTLGQDHKGVKVTYVTCAVIWITGSCNDDIKE
jgi:hypothetical protein